MAHFLENYSYDLPVKGACKIHAFHEYISQFQNSRNSCISDEIRLFLQARRTSVVKSALQTSHAYSLSESSSIEVGRIAIPIPRSAIVIAVLASSQAR